MARIALTGATGFVGGTVAAVLTAKGHDVTCLVRRDPGASFPWPHRVVDMQDSSALSHAVSGHVAILHMAIMNDFPGIYADRRAGWDAYVGLTRRVVDAANSAGAQVGYVSTDWVFDGTRHRVTEDEPPNPVNLYGFLKAASELVVLERARHGFVARVGAVQGRHQTQRQAPRTQDVGFGYFVLALVDALRDGERFCVWEDPSINSIATPIIASEIGALLGRAVDREVRGVLHFAGGTVVSRRELALTACSVFGLDAQALDFGAPPAEARLPAPVPYDTSMDGGCTMELLGSRACSIVEQLDALRSEMEVGAPSPLN